MRTIIVATDFTESSRNALDYTCWLAKDGGYRILLLHVYTMPVTYTIDGMALAAIKDAFIIAQDKLEEEAERGITVHPGTHIETRAITGGLLASLQDQISEEKPDIIVMGAAHDYTDIWAWDSELLTALTDLPVPVVLIPRHVTFTPIHQIGFACDYRNLCAPNHIALIRWLIGYFHAQLHVVHITRFTQPDEHIRKRNEATLQEALKGITTHYHAIEHPDVIESVAQFVKEHHIDLLVVIPHRHGAWYSMFHASHTKQLARLNSIPILALHD